jgi:tetratricopeptide (TPR) repeat protein
LTLRNESPEFTPMKNRTAPISRRTSFLTALGLALALVGAGCGGDQLEKNKEMVTQQQSEIEQMRLEIESLKANQNRTTYNTTATPPGGCDKTIETAAAQRAGDRFAANDFPKALGYYQDALMACPTDDQAEVNVARAYEAMGDKASAINHYRVAANRQSAVVSPAQEQAREALVRLQASRLD